MKGAGTDEDAIIRILGVRFRSQRLQIAQAYEQNFKRDLRKDLESETSGNFKELLSGLLMEQDEYDAWIVNRCIKGLGTDDDTLIEILCTKSNIEIKKLKEAYKKSLIFISFRFIFFFFIFYFSISFHIFFFFSIIFHKTLPFLLISRV